MSVDQKAKALKAKALKAKALKAKALQAKALQAKALQAKALQADEFTLSVEFAGICLYVIHPQRETVSVLMPTCVPRPHGGVSTKHEDGDMGKRHVPYLLMDLANLDRRVTSGLAADGPQFQVVRRLSREEFFFEPEEPNGSVIELVPDPLPLPDLSVFKGKIKLKDGLLSTIERDQLPELNARTILKGGTLEATTIGGSGLGKKRDDWDDDPAGWAGSIRWTRTIPGDSLTIRIRGWDTGQQVPLTLRPVTRGGRELIELKIAILCETNPLEWKEFEPRFEKDDEDFKWLFRLFEATDGGKLLNAIGRAKLPYPKLTPRGVRTTGNTGCTGGQFTYP